MSEPPPALFRPVVEVPLPASRNQLGKLGRRLAAGTTAPGDDELYVAFLGAYDRVQSDLADALRAVTDWAGVLPSLTIVGRTETRDTLIQKLRRRPGVQLPNIQDIAGVRIVGDMTLFQQNLLGQFLLGSYPGRLVDRRADPVAGYRALHAWLTVGGRPAEVQIRTRLQHLWAEMFEGMADRWGRQIRYGGQPDRPGENGSADDGVEFELRVSTVAGLQDFSVSVIAEIEALLAQAQVLEVGTGDGLLEQAVRRFLAQISEPSPVALHEAQEEMAEQLPRVQALHRETERQLLDLVTLFDNKGRGHSRTDTVEER